MEILLCNVNSNTKTKSVWNMIRKISSKYKSTPLKHLSQNNTKISNKKDISNLLAKKLPKISTSNNYCKLFQDIKRDDLKKKN